MLSRKVIRRLSMIVGGGSLLCAFIAVYCYVAVEQSADGALFSKVTAIPLNKVGLLLGTSKFLADGRNNLYFKYRIDATAELYHAGKISRIIISGDNGTASYNEPLDMKNELLARGIPDSAMYLDYAGFRTYDSVLRANAIFGQQSFTVISQQFHAARAVCIARKLGINTVGYCAKDVDAYNGFKTRVREVFARIWVYIDFLTNRSPRFLGEKIVIR